MTDYSLSRAWVRPSVWLGVVAVLLLLLACQTSSTQDTNHTFSFPTLKNKIGKADRVLIVLKDSSGKIVDVLFDRPVDSATRFEDLTAPNYSGGKVYIHIEATKNGETVYKVQRGYDPARGGDIAGETIVYVDPTKVPPDTVPGDTLPRDTTTQPRLQLKPDTLVLAMRGPSGRFAVEFLSAAEAGPVLWAALDPGVEISAAGFVTTKALGYSRVVAVSQANAAFKDTAWVQVLPVQPVDSLRFEKRTTTLLIQGPFDSLHLRVYPPLAPPGVLYTVRDTSLVRLAGEALQGLKEGETRVYAHSHVDPTKRDSMVVVVLSPRPADSVRIQQDTLKLFVKGPGQTLNARIYPSELAPLFRWSSQNPALASVDDQGFVSPVSQGQTQVVARSWSDSSKEDRAIVLIKKDTPRIQAGSDTIIARGTILTHTPSVTQEFGQLAMFKWDLDGDGAFEDSAASTPAGLPYAYVEAKEHLVRFYARDTEGNDTVLIRKVRAVNGRVVQITSPRDGSATNSASITVTWTVDGDPQSSTEPLLPGVNVVTRSSRDSAGNVYSHSISVTLDQTPPARPVVKGTTAPVNILTPRWSWASADTSGIGIFRFRLGNPDLSSSPGVADTEYVAASGLSGGVHTLYVQERDEAGNWSTNGSFTIRIDTTSPPAPTVQVQPAALTNETRPTWTWSGGPGDAQRYYRFKLGDSDFRTGARDTLAASFRPGAPLSEGVHTLYVQARDSAGNWSQSGSAAIRIDTTAPPAPTVQIQQTSPTNETRPTWTWSGGPGDAQRYYRYRLDNLPARDTIGTGFRPVSGLSEGPHTLIVQVRDSAGNWSATASAMITVDVTPPPAPRFDAAPYSPLNSLRPRWTWRSGGGGARRFRAALSATGLPEAPERTDSSFTPTGDLTETRHTLHVQERDAAGNWSEPTTKEIVVAIRKNVGMFSSGHTEVYAFHSDAQDNILLVYPESAIPASIFRAKRFNGSEWQDLGMLPLLGRKVFQNATAVSRTGTPFVVMEDSLNRAFVVQLSGAQWTAVGNPWALHRLVNEIKIAISNTNELFVAYTIRNESNVFQIILRRLNGEVWETFATKDFTESIELHALAITSTGVPIIFYLDNSYSPEKLIVQRAHSGSIPWEDVGNLTVHRHYGNRVLPFVKTIEDSLFIALREDEASQKNSVQKFNGSNWIPIGEMPNSEISTFSPLLAVSSPPARNKYFTCAGGPPDCGRVRVFRDNQWVVMPGISEGEVHGIASGKNGVPYIVETTGTHVSVWQNSFDP